MVEPLFWIELSNPPEIGSTVELAGSEGKHAATVRRIRQGERIQLTNGMGLRIKGSVSAVDTRSVFIKVDNVQLETPDELQLTLVQALAKGDRDELAVQAATELGITGVVPWQADRSISRWDNAKAIKGQARWQVICDEASKQSLRSYFPKVQAPIDSAKLPLTFCDFDKVLILDPTAQVGISEISSFEGRIALVVGPEGGISDEELAQFETAGATRVHLGASILRTSTAGVAAVAAIQTLSGRYGN